MATAAKPMAYPHIEKADGARAGKACIAGTRIAVVDIVRLHKQGMKPEEMLNYYLRPLTLAEVYSALVYYYDHKDEIEAYFEESQRAAAELEAKQAEYLSRQSGC